jgi:ABC-type Mn2+/Zn2+ transport system ATPase subunit
MDIEVTVSNYRCFADEPIRFALRDGLQSFVGVNGSGKTCILRLFYELRQVFSQLLHPAVYSAALTGTIQSGTLPNFNHMPTVKDPDEIFHDRNSRDLKVGFEMGGDLIDEASPPSRFEITISRGSNAWSAKLYGGDGRLFSPQGLSIAPNGFTRQTSLAGPTSVVSLAPIFEIGRVLSRTLYVGPFRNAVNIGGSGDYYDIQIGQPFIAHWRTLKTGYNKKQSQSVYRLIEDIRRIFGFETLDINASDDGADLLLMIDGKSYKQSEIGSGLIQFVLVLANAAIKNPSFILIDEPELNLHPSLQIDFLTTLASYATHGVLFATHNLGLARAVSSRVYSVRRVRDTREVRDFTGTKALAEFLGELGFNAYQDLGFETVLLVEGPTEVTCVQQLLRHFQKEHKIVLLPLGGSSMINAGSEMQLTEITRISNRVYALIDSERDQAGNALASDRRRFKEVCSKLGIECTVLERRAMENYFPERAIRLVKNSEEYRALGPYEKLNKVDPAWSKDENWRIARVMTKEELTGNDLGSFLEAL